MEDYLSLLNYENRYDTAICPHCGKLLKGRRHIYEVGGGLGNWDADYTECASYHTFRCKDCNIKASTFEAELSDSSTWKLPKELRNQKTITEKQEKYIKFLCNHFNIDVPYILSKEVATNFIKQFDAEYCKYKQAQVDAERRHNLFKEYGYTYSNFSRDEREHHYYKQTFNNCSIRLYYNEDTKKLTYNLNFGQGFMRVEQMNVEEDLSNVEKTIEILKKDIKELQSKILCLESATEQDARNKIEEEKEEAKKAKEYYEAHRYDYDDIDDFGLSMFDTF